MSDKHLRILNSVNGMLGILIGAVVIIAILLFVLMFKAESSDAPTVVPAFESPNTPDPMRLWIEETFTPSDLSLWDEFHSLKSSGNSDQEAIEALTHNHNISESLLKDHLQKLQHWIAAKDYPYSPENIKTDILESAISFHPGTAGSSLQRAQAAADILFNTADKHFHLCDDLDRRIKEATEMLTEEEQRWLSENLPGLTGEIDNVIKVFPEIDDIYDDAGAYTQVSRAMQMESVDEDWTAVKAALMEIEQ